MSSMFFNDWTSLLRILIVGALAYVALVTCLRISGKRTLSKMNAFDLVVTVALGSTLATIILDRNITLSEGVVALLLLIGLQFIVAWLSTRSNGFQALIKSQPRMLLYDGQVLHDALRHERLTVEELEAAARASGQDDIKAVKAIILETDGTLSVIGR